MHLSRNYKPFLSGLLLAINDTTNDITPAAGSVVPLHLAQYGCNGYQTNPAPNWSEQNTSGVGKVAGHLY